MSNHLQNCKKRKKKYFHEMTAELKALEFNKHDGTFTELSQKSHEKKSYDGMKQLHEKSN